MIHDNDMPHCCVCLGDDRLKPINGLLYCVWCACCAKDGAR